MSRDYEFRPDPEGSGNFDKLLLSQGQRFSLVRWLLFGVLWLAALLVQDVMVCDVDIYGAGMDLVPCVIIMITSLQGVESGCLFALITTLLYCFSGSAPGPYVLPMITILAMLAAIFRQACLRKGFFSILLSTGAGLMCYELLLFFIGLFLRYTTWQRLGEMALTALLSLLAVPVAYPIARAIGKIGGQSWNE